MGTYSPGPTVDGLGWHLPNGVTVYAGFGSPSGVITPNRIGDEYTDKTSGDLWKATGLANTDWTDLSSGSGGITQLTSDVTAGPGSGSQAATLATVATAQTTGDASHTPTLTLDIKGRITTIVNNAISIAHTQISDWAATLAGYLALAGGTMAGNIAMGANKITGLANGSAAQDAAAFGQISGAIVAQGYAGAYGDGSDGAAHFIASGSTTVAGATLSSGTYTMQRDIFGSGMTIDTTVVIVTNGYRIFDNGTLTNNGTIHWNGNAGATSTGTGLASGGAALSNATSSFLSTGNIGTKGGSSGTTTGSAGANGSASQAVGGAGGHGGSGSGGAGGVAGTLGLSAAYVLPRYVPAAIMGWMYENGSTAQFTTGGTGGGGGGGNSTDSGGAGGGGAGIVIVVAYKIAGTGTIEANGGAGGNGFNFASINTGGGAGGGGGMVIVVSTSISGGAISGQTTQALAGAPGSGNSSSTGQTAASGGTVILIPG